LRWKSQLTRKTTKRKYTLANTKTYEKPKREQTGRQPTARKSMLIQGGSKKVSCCTVSTAYFF